MTNKYISGLIALLLVVLIGVGIYAAVSHPQETASLPADAAAAVTDAAAEVTGSEAVDTTTSTAPASTETTNTTNTTNSQPATSDTTSTQKPGTFTMAQVQAHNSASSCYSVVNGSVYDLTNWIDRHPGGKKAILMICGKDGTSAFENQHGDDRRPANELAGLKIGTLVQ